MTVRLSMIACMEATIEQMTPGTSGRDATRFGQPAPGQPAADTLPLSIRRLLLATDLSSASERAADEAIRMAVDLDAELVVLSVIDPGRLRLPGGVFLRRLDQERSRIEASVQQLVGRARRAGAKATFLVWEGDPAEAILAASDAEGVDAIVLGSHGRGLLGRLVLGSTSTQVSEQATCRVIVIGA